MLNKRKNKLAYELAVKEGFIDEFGNRRKGVGISRSGTYSRRMYNPGDVASLMIPTGVAINAGIGLLNPLGGSGGYEAVLPSEETQLKRLMFLAIAAKYILGRTGNLLPYEEFSKYRPDVDIGEYNRYKAFKYVDITMTSVMVMLIFYQLVYLKQLQMVFTALKFNSGRSLPVTTTMIPYLGALAGGVMGVRNESPDKDGVKRKRPIKRGSGRPCWIRRWYCYWSYCRRDA